MAGVVSEDAVGVRSVESFANGHHSQSGEALAEWRSSEQVENGTPSTSPPYWDTDDDDDDAGPKPSDLYGKHTWKIEKFSQLTKRELRSNAFEVGGYKWYILIYPQGCDVCNHLSLFLCVANHDKLLPGWSHFAQFTIAVVNKDPKKSKYSDTLHRFWKKEHDWGWKKFMELSKVLDGFIDADTLIIKAQVQVIRERADRPFRCLDCQYRRELVRVYLTNVEQICRRFVEERRSKLGKLIEDKARWSSFRAFWLGIDQNARRRMSREKTDAILKVVVKHFFIEKEVTSTLVMDSLYSGLKALEGHTKSKKGKAKLLDTEEITAPIVHIEKDTFVLVDDVLLLLERAAVEPLPPKDEKGPQNRTKDGSSGEDFNKDSIERDERRLTELGRRTVEIFVLAHIFSSKVEVAYQEAIALKRQEELIREEEAAWQAESEQKARRLASEKDKKSKKKQAKQKRNNRKSKDKGREEKANLTALIREQVNPSNGKEEDTIVDEVQPVVEKSDMPEGGSDVSDSVEGASELLQPDSEDRDASPVNWDTDTSEVHPLMEASSSGISSLSSAQTPLSDKKSLSVMDDSSSTCSTDSVPSVVMNGPYKENSFHNYKKQKSPSGGKNQQKDAAYDRNSCTNEMDNQSSELPADIEDRSDVCGSNKPKESDPVVINHSVRGKIKRVEQQGVKKEEKVVSLPKERSSKNQVDMERILRDASTAVPSSLQNHQDHIPPTVEHKSSNLSVAALDSTPIKASSSTSGHQMEKTVPVVTSSYVVSAVKAEAQKSTIPKPTEKASAQQAPMMSRPSSAPLIPGPRATAPVVNVVHTSPLLARSVSAAGRLGPDPAPATHSYAPQSYRNAIMGNHVAPSTAGYVHLSTSTSGVSPSTAFSLASAMVSSPMYVPHSSERLDPNAVRSTYPFSMVTRDVLPNSPQWVEGSQRETVRSMHYNSSLLNDVQDLYKKPIRGSTPDVLSAEFPACTSGRQLQGFAEEFPHLDIINDLLDDENIVGISARDNSMFQSLGNGPTLLNRQFSLPGDMGGMAGDVGSSTSSCRFERTRSYHDGGFQRGYTSSISHYEPTMDFIPPSSQQQHLNGQIDGLVPNWRATSDLSLLGTRTLDFDGYQYLNAEYSNMAHGMNGYNIFRPSDGH
ncbi:TNF receptor-associated factor homolog 1a isoform X1 [Cucumis melo]|uniref:MATH domain-containing protein At5g43560 isoform X1 n=1 Tax=Cucumis melo TaxID=3656 RepID=A0A1S3AWT4_CUCME|nr:TNF receptor-associated factor homolog 1a isoform X1 [Cucumis melo]XP_008438565.1 TNF receptor-associated factor homolog 1a isoform X1 [Cucumis melo]